jgi:hypothetical protein
VRGIVWYGGKLNAWRDNVAASAGVLHHSSGGGWTATDLGQSLTFTAGGPYEVQPGDVITGDQSGATATVRYIGVDTGDWTSSDAAGSFILDNVVGTFGDETLSIGTHLANRPRHAERRRRRVPSGRALRSSRSSTSTPRRASSAPTASTASARRSSSTGTASPSSPTGSRRRPAAQERPRAQEPPVPRLPVRQLQHSALGDAARLLRPLGRGRTRHGPRDHQHHPQHRGDDARDFTDRSISALTGNDSSDWPRAAVAEKPAPKPYTAQRIGDVDLPRQSRGALGVVEAQAYGNFKLGTYTRSYQQGAGRARRPGSIPVASCVIKSKDQYLLFFSDGSGISLWFGAKQPEAMLFQYPFVVSCLCRRDRRGRAGVRRHRGPASSTS